MQADRGKANYGVDAPGVMRGFLLGGLAMTLAAGLVPVFLPRGGLRVLVRLVIGLPAAALLALGGAMTAYALRGKYRQRDYMLSLHAWRGDEQVLDIGTGRGLLLIGAAKRLTTGKATGIDIWNVADLSDNHPDNALQNALLEGVSERVEILSEDARRMPFADQSFDVILSLLCLHNIEDVSERGLACREIARVLKPGGEVIIGDYVPTGGYAAALQGAGLTVERVTTAFSTAYALMWMVVAHKEGRG